MHSDTNITNLQIQFNFIKFERQTIITHYDQL